MNREIEIEECTVSESIACGFKQEWISGSNDDISFSMNSGAGCGNRHLQIQVNNKGGTKHYNAVEFIC